MAKNISEQDGQRIVELYLQGKSYSDIKSETGYAIGTIAKRVKGLRTHQECITLARKQQGKYKISDEGRKKLSEAGKQSCQRSGKFYTKPERCFKELLNEIGIGVKFPEYIKEIKGVSDDEHPYCLFYQYPLETYVIDYIDLNKKIVININGDYWHANPLLYDLNNLHYLQKTNVWHDKNKREYLEKLGWTIVDIWESEIYWNKALVIQRLKAVGITGTHGFYISESGVQLPHSLPSIQDWSEQLKAKWFRVRKERKPAKINKAICQHCGKEFEYKGNGKRQFCSYDCHRIAERRVSRPSKEELEKLVKELPMTKIGKMFGVSDNAIRKWLKASE